MGLNLRTITGKKKQQAHPTLNLLFLPQSSKHLFLWLDSFFDSTGRSEGHLSPVSQSEHSVFCFGPSFSIYFSYLFSNIQSASDFSIIFLPIINRQYASTVHQYQCVCTEYGVDFLYMNCYVFKNLTHPILFAKN